MVAGMRTSKRANAELSPCRDIFDHAKNVTVNQGLLYRIDQNTIVTRNGIVTIVV